MNKLPDMNTLQAELNKTMNKYNFSVEYLAVEQDGDRLAVGVVFVENMRKDPKHE